MPNRFAIIIIVFILLLATAAQATTWLPVKKTDPLTGDPVEVSEIVSYGDYIYLWPSKYDVIYWPLTDPHWIWFCPKSGYASFANDFSQVDEVQKKALVKWLKKNYDPKKKFESHAELLEWVEKIYKQREMDDDFWCRFYRLMAYTYRDEPEMSIKYVRIALPLLEKELDKGKGKRDFERISVVYLLGEYNRRLGKTDLAIEFFNKAKEMEYKDEHGTVKKGHPYFIELIDDRMKLIDAAKSRDDKKDGK